MYLHYLAYQNENLCQNHYLILTLDSQFIKPYVLTIVFCYVCILGALVVLLVPFNIAEYIKVIFPSHTLSNLFNKHNTRREKKIRREYKKIHIIDRSQGHTCIKADTKHRLYASK